MLPDRVTRALPPGARVVEVGVGGRWATLEALHAARPDLVLVATDLHPERLAGAPTWAGTAADDVTRPRPSIYRGAALVYAVRCPEELQRPLARLARGVGAGLAIQALKDEWTDLGGLVGPHELVNSVDGRPWRWWPR